MESNYTIIKNLAGHQEIPEKGILTQTLCDHDHVKAVLFTFSRGQELSEHTASVPAALHFVQGQADLRLNEDSLEAEAGTWVHMPAGMKHSIRAKTALVMLLLLIKRASP